MLLLPARCGVAMAQDTYAKEEGGCEIRLAYMLSLCWLNIM